MWQTPTKDTTSRIIHYICQGTAISSKGCVDWWGNGQCGQWDRRATTTGKNAEIAIGQRKVQGSLFWLSFDHMAILSHQICQVIQSCLADRTVLTIAHRVDTVLGCDRSVQSVSNVTSCYVHHLHFCHLARVLVMEDGCIVESGHPNILLQDGETRWHRITSCTQFSSRNYSFLGSADLPPTGDSLPVSFDNDICASTFASYFNCDYGCSSPLCQCCDMTNLRGTWTIILSDFSNIAVHSC